MNTDKQLEVLISYLETNKIFYRENYSLKYETYFKMGGKVKCFITPQSYDKFKQAVIFLQSNHINYKVIGFTSNIILFDEIEYSVILSPKNLTLLEIQDNVVQVEAGYSLQDFVRVVAILNNSEGYEGLEGIPASIGGAIVMNAGAYGHDISDNLISVECIDKNNQVIILEKKDCHFRLRNSIFRRSGNYVILKAKFKLKNGNKDLIAKNIEKFHIARHLYQDFVYPNLGSMIVVRDDAYKLILSENLLYSTIFWILKYGLKNPVSKFILRKRPNNIVFNKLLFFYLKYKKHILLKYKLSPKSLNILINDGSVSAQEIVNYIFLLNDLLENKCHLENELVIEPAYKINPEFETTLNIIIDRLNNQEKNENSTNYKS
ncbi:UDP-N-acetylmuramate dehydrogenase [Thioploca ingrica]|uniref:UDP-N-acetylenolpyruvoylglucosamine reductase n=1 Tax=Thioploca ingrica TaxID=40754 RepID=A0A090ADJ0_9GAMM|nr:UDP-N-acetylmuramate dehydrogenase [Thioploca ingrica]